MRGFENKKLLKLKEFYNCSNTGIDRQCTVCKGIGLIFDDDDDVFCSIGPDLRPNFIQMEPTNIRW